MFNNQMFNLVNQNALVYRRMYGWIEVANSNKRFEYQI